MECLLRAHLEGVKLALCHRCVATCAEIDQAVNVKTAKSLKLR